MVDQLRVVKVKKRPTTYAAVQYWSEDDSESIEAILENTQSVAYAESQFPFVTIHNAKKDRYDDVYLNPGDWVVVSSKGKVKIVGQYEFPRNYRAAKTDLTQD